jgi:nucleotide-binding universal stress UspA family protein
MRGSFQKTFARADQEHQEASMNARPRNILAATDYSETAERAVALAGILALRFSADLHLLHVAVLVEGSNLDEGSRDQLDHLQAISEETRRELLEKSSRSDDVSVTPLLVRGFDPDEVIVETASNLGCDLIVMGTHGRRGLSHLFLGSVAERVVRTSPAPVLTLRADAVVELDGVTRILVPYDFSDASADAIRHAAAWADAVNGEITLLHVVEPVVYPEFYSVDILPDNLMMRLTTRSEEALVEAAAELLDGRASSTLVEVGRAADTIVNLADPDRFDLVVMATRGLSGLEHVLLGSVAESVLRRCRVPMLTVPSQ